MSNERKLLRFEKNVRRDSSTGVVFKTKWILDGFLELERISDEISGKAHGGVQE